jgi:creatinine amidohydrolase
VGVDCFSAQAFAAAAARRLCTTHPDWNAIIFPILPIGSDTFDYLGSINIRRRVVRDLLTDFLGSLATYGFHHIQVINSHGGPGHLMAIDEACHAVNQRFGSRAFAPMSKIMEDIFSNEYRDTYRKILGKGEALDFSSDHHAGHWETSMLLYLRPELVDSGYTRLRPVIVEAESISDTAAGTYGDRLGYFGSPSQANRELGKVSTALIGREIVDMFFLCQEDEAFLKEFEPPMWNARMVYRTDFTRWVLGLLILVLALATWALFS